jgi:hypothetical protein
MNKLSSFNHTIEDYNEIFNVVYTTDTISGTCIYQKYKPLSRFQQGDILQLTECNMGEIINHINEKSPLTEGDLISLQMEIRTDSLAKLKDYISSLSGTPIQM